MAKGQKADFKQFLLNKGEYLAMGLAGFFLVVLFGMGVSRWAGAKDPAKISQELTGSAQNLQRQITSGEPTEEQLKLAQLPPFLDKIYVHKPIDSRDFQITGPLFDPIARPDTKRENPRVWPLGEFQADIIKAPMKGFDIYPDPQGEGLKIAVVVAKKINDQDKAKLEKLGKYLAGKINKNRKTFAGAQNFGGTPPGGGGVPPGGAGGMPPGGGQLGPGPGDGDGRFPGMGNMGGGFNTAAQRVDKAIEYINLDELPKAISKDGKVPAMTVIPLRAIVLHVEVPYGRQLEEFKRALRLKSPEDARRFTNPSSPGAYGPTYDGYEVQRRVTRVIDGKEVVIVDWPKDLTKPNYDFEAKYGELVHARKLEDQIEDGMMLHFLRYDMALSLPLPRLAEDVGGKYPPIRLPGILATIRKMKEANRPPEEQDKLLDRLRGRDGRPGLYSPQRGQDTGAQDFFGEAGGVGTGRPMAPGGGGGGGLQPPIGPRPPVGGTGEPGDMEGTAAAPPVEIDHLLLRLVDVDVQPGYTYQYRIRLRMLNPNYGDKMRPLVSNPAYTKDRILYSPWTQLPGLVTIPTEEFTFAIDPAAYRTKIAEEYKDAKDRELRERLQAKDHQAVIEVAKWMEQVSIGSGKREPVGAWVVADIPTGRGEYVGRKHYVKLPLWSALTTNYVLREVADRLITKKDATQPKGWLVDFTSQNILVDFEGGKVRTKTRNRDVTEDVSTEMLILREDGQLEVKKSVEDEDSKARQQYLGDWESWVKKVEVRKEVTPDEGFQRGPGMPPGGGSSP